MERRVNRDKPTRCN